MRIERVWAMPDRRTFTIKPIAELLKEELTPGRWVDPFAGFHSPAQVTNDLNPETPAQYHMDALDFLRRFDDEEFDGALFDPPYSFRQAKECYRSFGAQGFSKDMEPLRYWSCCKDEMARIVRTGGKVLCFGWTSMGMGKQRGFKVMRILLVPHGGSKNDTICTVEIKRWHQEELPKTEGDVGGTVRGGG